MVNRAGRPTISVIIPYYNEAETLPQTLGQLSSQTIEPSEILLVDSGSTDRSLEIIDTWSRETHRGRTAQVRNIRARTGVPSSSKNVGIREATGEILAFMDCGLVFPPHWLESNLAMLQAGSYDLVSGHCILKGESPLDMAAVAQTYGYLRPCSTVPSSLVKRYVFEKTGLFLEGRRAGYDTDWALRVQEEGLRRGSNANVIVGYLGFNYARDLRSLYLKSIVYTRTACGIPSFYQPEIYLTGTLLAIAVAVLQPSALPWVFAAYLLLRGLVIPGRKSRVVAMLRDDYRSVLLLPVAGITIDAGRTVGSVLGTLVRFKKRPL